MGRTLCVWFPDWPLRCLNVPSDEPAQVVDDSNQVVAANSPARSHGIEAGMARRQAEALCPAVVTHAQDQGIEARAFEPVVVAMETLVPRVELVHPGLTFVPIAGAVRYYGGEETLVAEMAASIERVAGPGAALGVAQGPFAARHAAARAVDGPLIITDEAAFLASLDVGAIGKDDLASTFRWLGITTLGELARLPRAAVASRFGQIGLDAHRYASGEDRETQPRVIPDSLAVEESYEEPLVNLEQAGFAARRVAHGLLDRLRGEGVAPHRVEIEAEAVGGKVLSRVWRNADPFDEVTLAERVRWQLRAWVESGGIPGGLRRLRVMPADVSDEGRQLGLAEDPVSEAEATRALIRAQSLVGPNAVLQAHPQGGRDPADRVRWFRWGEPAPAPTRDPAAPWPGRLPAPSPALVPPEPRPLTVEWERGHPTRVRLRSRWEPVVSWAGPWRRMGRWWEGEEAVDRYQLVTSAGAFLCEVHDGKTFLVGVYD
ncbi:MAG: DNA polymerase Y family protein [Acidimicrobiia bacterium]|nr:DNA polymerase Y family protein [Acidimicrobiia bacterium]NNL71188.1 DNA polymerase Y family protein [Acidimicrobiia bacterium]